LRTALQWERSLTFFSNWTGAFASVATIGLDLPRRSHGTLSRYVEKKSIGECCVRHGQRVLNGYLKLEPEHDFQHSGEFRITLGRMRPVEALPTKAHCLCDCDIPLARGNSLHVDSRPEQASHKLSFQVSLCSARSVFPPKADIRRHVLHVVFGQTGNFCCYFLP
jgi:hypothetical protein